MIVCGKKDTCANFEKKCHECAALCDLTNHYPLYKEKTEFDNARDIYKIIDDAMEKRDRFVSILITKSSTHVNVYPNTDDGMKWIVSKPSRRYERTICKCSKCGGTSESTDLYCRHCGEMRTGIIEVNNDAE